MRNCFENEIKTQSKKLANPFKSTVYKYPIFYASMLKKLVVSCLRINKQREKGKPQQKANTETVEMASELQLLLKEIYVTR